MLWGKTGALGRCSAARRSADPNMRFWGPTSTGTRAQWGVLHGGIRTPISTRDPCHWVGVQAEEKSGMGPGSELTPSGGERPTRYPPPPRKKRSPGTGMGTGQTLFRRGGGSVGSQTHPPKKIVTQNLAEGNSNLNKRPLCGTDPDPPPFNINSL